MKKTCSIIALLTFALICQKAVPQPTAAIYNQQHENLPVISQISNVSFREASPIRFQLSTLIGLNMIGSEKKISASVDPMFKTDFNNKSFAVRPVIDYFFSRKAGIGISYDGFENNFVATSYTGTQVIPGGWFIIYFPDTYTDYYDEVSITTTGNIFSIHGTYRPVSYSKEGHQPFEFITRAGLSMAVINEEQQLTTYLEKEDLNGYIYYKAQSASYRFKNTALTGLINAQVVLHLTKYFSFVLLDVTQHFGLINPEVPQTSVTVDHKKTINTNPHKLTASGFTFSTGLAMHF